MPYCPQCQREFEVSGGFCPFDGETLKAGTAPGKRNLKAATPEPREQLQAAREKGENEALDRLRSEGAIEDDDNYDHLLGVELDGRYKITRKVGEGGMGVVFFAKHIVIEKPVAIKVLKKRVGGDANVVKRFVQEARAASRIGHPNIVDVTDFGETPDGLTYQVMEFIEGKTLDHLIAQGPVDVERALRVVAQIATALAAAHKKGIVHRDLKPENIFLCEQHGRTDFVKIVDFGIAKVTKRNPTKSPRLTRAGSVFGTPEYMAPEQASGRGDIDARADIYSLGAIFYEMLTGQVPLSGDTTVRTLAMVILDPIERPRTINPELDITDSFEAAMMRALAKNRDDRYESMEQFLSAMERVAGSLSFTERIGDAIRAGLSALPPGASTPDTVPDVPFEPAAEDTSKPTEIELHPAGAQIDEHDDERDTKHFSRDKRGTHDPPFVATARPGYDHIDEGYRRRHDGAHWPAIIGVSLVVLGAAVAAYFVWSGGTAKPTRTAAVPAIEDAGPVPAAVDAAPPAPDAAVADAPAAAPDAAVVVRKHGKPTGRDPRIDRTKPPVVSGTFRIKVNTDPEGGLLIVDGRTVVSDGATLDLAAGTVHRIKCRKTGYKDGMLRVSKKPVKGSRMLCRMKKGCNLSDVGCPTDVRDPFPTPQ